MKNKVKCIFFIIIIIEMVFSIKNFAYEESEKIEDEEHLIINYNVSKSEEEKFLSEIQRNYEKNDIKYEFISAKNNTEEITNKKITDKVILNDISTNNKEKIKTMVKKSLHYEDEEGYIGEMSISNIDISPIDNGVYEQIEKLDIPINNLSTNDLINIEKEMYKDGKKWYFINADWEKETSENIDGYEVIKTYNGILHYQTIVQYNNPNTYNAIIHYSGSAQIQNPIYNYSVVYKKIKSKQDEEALPEVIEESTEDKNTNYVIPVVIVSGIGIVFIATLIFIKKRKTGGKSNVKER